MSWKECPNFPRRNQVPPPRLHQVLIQLRRYHRRPILRQRVHSKFSFLVHLVVNLQRDEIFAPPSQSVPDWGRVLTVAPFLRPAAFGPTSEQIRAYDPAPVLLSHIELGHEFLQQLNSFSDDFQEITQQAIAERSFSIKMMEYTGLGVSGVQVAWLVRSGTLLSSKLAALPARRNFDPIGILDMDKQGR